MASLQADQAIEAGAIYYSNVLANVLQATSNKSPARFEPYMLPATNYYKTAAVKVGEAMFWFIGRDTNDTDFLPPLARPRLLAWWMRPPRPI